MKNSLLILTLALINFGFSQTKLTHSTDEVIWSFDSTACITSGLGTIENTSFIRVYDTDDFNVQDTVFFISIDFAVHSTSGGAYNLIGKVHELNGTLMFANMSLLAQDTIGVYPDSGLYTLSIPLKDGYAIPGDTLVTEVFAEINPSIIFYAGSNPYPETDDSYIAALGCGIPEPVTLASLTLPTTHFVLNLWVNHRPAMNDFARSVFKENMLAFNDLDFNAAMNDYDNDTVGMIQILTLPANGVIENNGTPLMVGDTVLNTELDLMTYLPNPGYFGSDSFDFRVRDNSHWSIDSTNIDITVMNWQLAIDENEKGDFVIFPNPTNTTFQIKSKENIELIQIYSSSGRLIETISASTSLIDVSEYTAGAYFVALTTEKGILVQKLIKE